MPLVRSATSPLPIHSFINSFIHFPHLHSTVEKSSHLLSNFSHDSCQPSCRLPRSTFAGIHYYYRRGVPACGSSAVAPSSSSPTTPHLCPPLECYSANVPSSIHDAGPTCSPHRRRGNLWARACVFRNQIRRKWRGVNAHVCVTMGSFRSRLRK